MLVAGISDCFEASVVALNSLVLKEGGSVCPSFRIVPVLSCILEHGPDRLEGNCE